MKAVTAVCPTTGATIAHGRVHRHRRDVENEEIQMYLSKLKDLVPFMPKNRKLTKLEVIQNVIDYICDLQSALESHPQSAAATVGFDAAAALRATANSNSELNFSLQTTAANLSNRQPLGVRPTPNTILPVTAPTSDVSSHISTSLIPIPEKLSPSDGRPVSC